MSPSQLLLPAKFFSVSGLVLFASVAFGCASTAGPLEHRVQTANSVRCGGLLPVSSNAVTHEGFGGPNGKHMLVREAAPRRHCVSKAVVSKAVVSKAVVSDADVVANGAVVEGAAGRPVAAGFRAERAAR